MPEKLHPVGTGMALRFCEDHTDHIHLLILDKHDCVLAEAQLYLEDLTSLSSAVVDIIEKITRWQAH